MRGSEPVPSSFRDPSGFLFTRDGTLYRQVDPSFAEHYDRLMTSGLYGRLTEAGLLIPHEEVDLALAAARGAHRVLRPERVGFVSYPYEWSFSMLRDAALATLRIQTVALDHGMTLRDASAYNIQFHGGKPVLIDTLSLGGRDEGSPWVAYRQFCQHFLAPLALMAHRDVRLAQLLRVHIDGVPLDLAAGLLPRRTKLSPSLLAHIHLHARSQKRYERVGADERAAAAARRSISERSLRGLIASLTATVRRMRWKTGDSVWGKYYAEEHNYTDEALDHKAALVAKFVEELRPSSVWDLGGNTGRFGRLASDRGIPTVCFDFDPSAVEANYRQVVRNGETAMLPLVLDLTNPSGGIGWDNRERSSIAERGPADLGLALALVHHLAISNNVPLPHLADTFRALCRLLIVEFVPKSDSKVRTLLATREDVFPGYTQDGFETAFAARFTIERREQIQGSERTLYLMRGR